MPNSNLSFWKATTQMPRFEPISEDLTADVCIIGAGLGGVTSAYLLSQQGLSVVLVEAYEVGAGETGQTTAHWVNAFDDRYFDIERTHSRKFLKLLAESHTWAIDFAEKTSLAEGIDSEFERLNGYLFLQEGDKLSTLKKEIESAHHAGLDQVAWIDSVPGLHIGPALVFPNQGQLHPLKYLKGLVEKAVVQGARVFTQSPVSEVDEKNGTVRTKNGYVIRSKAIVVATNSPINDRVRMHTKQAPYRTYVCAFRIPKGSIPHALFWDTGFPYHYVRLQKHPTSPEHEILIVGGEDHKTGQSSHPEDAFKRLETWARSHFLMAEKVEYQWSGQVLEPTDGIGYLGKNPGSENVYIITGDSGNGMTHTTIGAKIISDLIFGRPNPWVDLYSPSRTPVRSAPEYIKENLNVGKQYMDWISPGEVKSLDDIKAGEGAIYRSGLNKIAAFRDSQGELHLHSAVCTHMGCIVGWNSQAESWDCPCHGSRFSPTGEVICGPATKALANVDDEIAPKNSRIDREDVPPLSPS